MHREFHHDDLREHTHPAFGGAGATRSRLDRGLCLLVAVLAALIALELLQGWLPNLSVARYGVSWIWIAALLGTARVTYTVLEHLLAGHIGADFALAQASLAALVLREPLVAAEVVFIAAVGELLEAVAATRAFRAIGRLLDRTPRTARVVRDGVEHEVPIDHLVPGDLVRVGTGEVIPVDGRVERGQSTVDVSSLTGEPIPVDIGPGQEVFTGTMNHYGVIECRTERVGADSTLGQVIRLVQDAQRRKAPIQRAADRYARYFLPVVECVALATLLAGWLLGWADTWRRAVAVLVVACPCALVLATPAAVLAALAWLARRGVIAKGGVALERMASVNTLAFDKTGTLTQGRPRVASVAACEGIGENDVLLWAAAAERGARHPVAAAIIEAARERNVSLPDSFDVTATPGAGLAARVVVGAAEHRVLVGSARWLAAEGVAGHNDLVTHAQALEARGETPAFVARDGQLLGVVGLTDTVRPEAHDIIHELKHLGIGQVALITGDRPAPAHIVAKRVHIKEVLTEQTPSDKARWVEEAQARGRRVAMVGDGINDAPALARADVGIAIGGTGADLAAEAGDVVLLGSPLAALPDLVRMSRAMMSVIRQNILGFAFGLNAGAMLAASLGWLEPVPAAILHQGASLLVLLNALRLLGLGKLQDWGPRAWLRGARRAAERIDAHWDAAAVVRWIARSRLRLAGTIVLPLLLVATWACVLIVDADEVALISRLGRPQRILTPGLHVRLPSPFETVALLRPSTVRSLELTAARDTAADDLLMCGDGQLVEVAARVQYRNNLDSDSLWSHATMINAPESTLAVLATAALRAEISHTSLQQILTSQRGSLCDAVAERLRPAVANAGLGLRVLSVVIDDIRPPPAVVSSYRDVTSAEIGRAARTIRARTEVKVSRMQADADMQAEAQAAVAARRSAVVRAVGRADAFVAQSDARRGFPALSDYRRYWRTLAAALAGRKKLIIDGDASNTTPRLFLNDPTRPLDLLLWPPNAPETFHEAP